MVILSLPLMASVVPVPGTLREDHLVAFLHGLQRAEHALDIGLHRLVRIRHIVAERLVECSLICFLLAPCRKCMTIRLGASALMIATASDDFCGR